FTNSAIHMVAHGAWAQALMAMGGAELGLAKGKLHSRWWRLATPIGIAVSGAAFLVHEQNGWFFARSAFLHHLVGWTLVGAALVAPAAASAHATLRGEFPGFQQELQNGPAFVRLHFDQLVQLPTIEVLDVHGMNHAAPAVARGLDVSAKVRSLPKGAYTIRWHV